MKEPHVFDSFARLLGVLPTKGVFKVVELESQMLNHDFDRTDTENFSDVDSILSFNRFIVAAKQQVPFEEKINIPINHIALYRNTVERLIAAGELLPEAKRQFDAAFTLSSWEVLVC